ncbi:MAG: ABC transporter permease [Lachnospiraceae bacterium]
MKGKTIFKKVFSTIVTLLLVSFLVFLAFAVIPGDPAVAKLGINATPERIEALREEMGLNRPFFVRYFDWLFSFLKGEMGTSYSYGIPVSQMILDKLPITLTMTLMAFAMVVAISIPVGIYAAKHQGGWIDRTVIIINQIFMAIPPFFAGILITVLFGMVFKLFTPGGYVSYSQNFGRFLRYLIFPAFAIALPKAAMSVKLLRSSLLEQAKLDYTRTAYSRGNTTKSVLYRHMLQNAMIPVITFFGMALADIFTGSIIIEQVFNIPGLGRILLTSISNRDYPVVMAIIVCLAFAVIVINLFVDIIYHIVDPRIRAEE